MKVYRCLARLRHHDDDKNRRTAAVYYTRKGDKAKSEKAIKAIDKNERYDIHKFTHTEFDIPTNKVGLVEFLNKKCNR